MPFKHRPKMVFCLVFLAFTAAMLGGCLQENERVRISPASDTQSQADLGLGPGVSPLSSGPGEKGSPSWSPSGEKIAFTVDGYLAEKRPEDRDFQRRTTKDFNVESVAWTSSGESLAILGKNRTPASEKQSSVSGVMDLYRTASEESSLDVTQTATGVRAIAPDPGNTGGLLALASGGSDSRFAFAGPEGEVRAYAGEIPGKVTGISFSPSGDEAAVAVRTPSRGNKDLFELRSLSFPEGDSRLLTSLNEGLEVLGSPQIAEDGAVYFVAGEKSQRDERDAASYRLYRINPGAAEPESVSAVGNDFVASSLECDPDGRRLAVVGRRNTSSPTNLYILDIASKELEAATSNEEMEIKTGTEDLDWSPDGSSITIVARAASTDLEVYATPADNLVSDFYNLYEVPTEEIPEGGVS